MRVHPDSGAVLPGPVEPIYVYEAPVRIRYSGEAERVLRREGRGAGSTQA